MLIGGKMLCPVVANVMPNGGNPSYMPSGGNFMPSGGKTSCKVVTISCPYSGENAMPNGGSLIHAPRCPGERIT